MPLIDRRSLIGSSVGLSLARIDATASRPSGFPPLTLRPTVFKSEERWTLDARMRHHSVPGAAIAIIRGGRIAAMRGFGTRIAGQSMPVGPGTLFSVGSVSKVATASLCLKLVESGKLSLDEDVNRQLRHWRVPAGVAGDERAITLRMLLSHTAGVNVHGFEDYPPAAPLPTTIETLNGVAPALSKPLARVDRAGTRSRYSGGGYMIVQAVIEDVMGQPFATVARQHLLAPLGMERSRFIAAPDPGTADIAHAHDNRGQAAALPRGWQSFPELAPSGFWTTTNDLVRLVLALGTSYRETGGFLSQELAIAMMTPVAPGFNGLGVRLAGDGVSRIFHHAGANDSYKAYVEGNLATGDGLVVVTNGAGGDVLADEIRNAVSDAFAWSGDWSVRLGPVPLTRRVPDPFAGRYRRREGQAPEVAGFLDTGFSAESLEVVRTPDGLQVMARGRQRQLAPVTPNSFVMPDGYVPADVLRFTFDSGPDGHVHHMRIEGAGGLLLFDRV